MNGSAALSVQDGHGNGATTSGTFAGPNVDLTVNISGGSDQLLFDVSQELIDRGFSPNGRLVGGAIPPGGAGNTPLPSAPPLPFGPTQGTVTFRTTVLDSFEVDFPSGNSQLTLADSISDEVDISGDLLHVSNLTPNGNSQTDDSASSNTAPRGSFTKTVYAINGVTGNYTSSAEISPGDTVTYRLRYVLPSGDVENFILRDFLPLPIFDVDTTGAVTDFDNVVSAAAPAAGRAKLGPDDTFTSLSGLEPTVTTDSVANSLVFTYGTYSDTTNSATVVDILFTVTVSNDPFADELLLSNGAQAESNNTVLDSITEQAIGQITLREPELNIRKGVIATENIDGIFAPTTTGPVVFTPPGSAGTRFTGTITSADVLATPIDSDLSNVDAGDLVSYAITIENTGGDPDGAFDLLIRDTLPTGAALPGIGPEGYNLRVTDGAGNALAYTVIGAGLFDPNGGIELVDSPGQGAIGPDATDGSNIVIITFDLRITNVVVLQTVTDTARIANYSASEGGPNFVSDPLEDDAVVQIGREDLLSKRLVSTEIIDTYNANNEAVIGELVTYEVTLVVPEGVMVNTLLTDTLDSQLAFVQLLSVVASPGLSVTTTPVTSVTNDGRNLTYDFGDIINDNRDNSVDETIVITYQAVVLNVSNAQGGTNVNNLVRLTFEGLDNAREASAENVLIIEPNVLVDKSVTVNGSGNSGDAGDPVVYSITLTNPPQSNTSTANAFDLTFSDALPLGGLGSFILTAPGNFTVTDSLGLVNTTHFQLVGDNVTGWTLQTAANVTFDMLVDPTRTITLTVTGTLSPLVEPGHPIDNVATIRWSSLDGNVTIPRSTFNTDSVERTGAGGINDYIKSDNAIIQVDNANLSKTLVSTSETATADPNRLVVGEIGRFRLQVSIPEGFSNSLQIQDLIPTGLQFLDDGTARIAFVGDPGDILLSSTIPGNTTGLNIAGNETTIANITPVAAIPAGAITGGAFSDGTDVTFDLGLFINTGASDPNREFVVIEFNALVTNIGNNQADTVLINTAQVIFGGDVNTTGSTQIVVAEPNIPFLDKTMLTPAPGGIAGFDAGDRLDYSVEYQNDATPSAAVAYDVHLSDPLVAGKMLLDTSSVHVFRNGVEIFTGFSTTLTPTSLDVIVAQVDVGDQITVLYTVTLTNAVNPGETLTNTADLDWSSLPLGNGTPSNPTGSTVPGLSGEADGERDGSDGPGQLNDYTVEGQDSIDIAIPEFEKQISTTSPVETTNNQFDPNVADFAVGEIVTYRLTATLQEGTTPLIIRDLLPTAPGVMQYISSRVVSIGSNITGSSLSVGQAGVVAGQLVTFDFGNVTNAGDNVVDSRDLIVVEVIGQVTNVPQNVAGTLVINLGELDYGGDATLLDFTPGEVVEPELTIVKDVVAPTPTQVDADDLVTYRVTVAQDSANSTAIAFNVLLSETLPTGLTLVGTPTVIFHPNYSSSFYQPPVVTVTGNSYTVLIDYLDHPESPFAQGITNEAIIEYTARVDSSVLPGNTIINTANVSWDSFYVPSSTDPMVSRNYTDSDPANVTLNTNSISGFIYVDLNDNGVYEPGSGETLITESVTLQLTGLDHLGNAVVANVTTTTGQYSFDGLRPTGAGGYTITQLNQPPNHADGRDTPGTPFGGNGTLGAYLRDADAITGANIPLGSNTTGVDYNFGELPPASIGDFVWNDTDGDGEQDIGELGEDGVSVELTGTNPDGSTFTLTDTTSGGGAYLFSNLRPGAYQLVFTLPTGFVFTIANAAGVADTLDSDVNRNGNASATLGIGESNTTIDAGLYVAGSLAGFVYRDYDIDGLREPAASNPETGLANITVILNGVDLAGTPFAPRTTTTAADGSYSFDLLAAGNYTITEIQPPSVFDAGLNGFYDGLDTPGTIANTTVGTSPLKNVLAVSLGAGDDGIEYNFGENPPADPFGYVYIDSNLNGSRDPGEPGIRNVTVTISGIAFTGTSLERPLTAADVPGGLTRTTDTSGRWEFLIIPPGTYTFIETQPAGYRDADEENADPNGPHTVIVGNDRFDNVVMSPFPIRGPFNYGEFLSDPGPLPPITPPVTPTPDPDNSKRELLASTTPPPLTPVPGVVSEPNYTAVRGPTPTAPTFVAVSGDNGFVRVFDYGSGNERFRFQPYGNFSGGVRVAVGDVNADGIQDIVTIAGPGGAPHVMVYDGLFGGVLASFYAFDASFTNGGFVAVGDMNADGHAEIIVTPDVGGSPTVSVFDGQTFNLVSSFLALESGFLGGLRVAAGDVNNDGRADVVVTAGDGGGPRIAGFSGASIMAGNPTRLFNDFYAMDASLRMGFYVSVADMTGDGYAEIFVSAGKKGGPRVTAIDGQILTTTGVQSWTANFFAGDPNNSQGIRIVARDLNGDGRAEVEVVGEEGSSPYVSTYDTVSYVQLDQFNAFGLSDANGLYVG